MRERTKYKVKQYIEVLPVWAVKRCSKHGLLTRLQCLSEQRNQFRCRQCSSANKKKNYCPAKINAQNVKLWPLRKKQLYKRKFGLTHQEQETMLKKQKNLCAICKKPQQEFKGKAKKNRSLYLDHCHDSGKAREFLCASCNSALGFFNDDIKLMKVAIQYLNKHKTILV